MSGPDHYREAERLLQPPDQVDRAGYGYPTSRSERTALAQVHATLALVAATVDQTSARGPGDVDRRWTDAVQ